MKFIGILFFVFGLTLQASAAADVEVVLQLEHNGQRVKSLPVFLTDISVLEKNKYGCFRPVNGEALGEPEARFVMSNEDGRVIFEKVPRGTYVLRYSLLRDESECGEMIIDVRADILRPDVKLGPFLLNVKGVEY